MHYNLVLSLKKKKLYICERTSSHIEFQDNILNDEYKSLGLNYKKINNWYIDRENKNMKIQVLF